MGAPINAVNLPTDVQAKLPAGVKVFGFDGEVSYRGKNNNNEFQIRTFGLSPVTDNEFMYERRYLGSSLQETYLPIEHFQTHIVTVYYVYIPTKETARTGTYRVESIAAVSWNTQQWISVQNPNALELVFEGPIEGRMGKELFKQFTGMVNRRKVNDGYVTAVDALVGHLQYEMKRKLQQQNSSGGRLE